MSLPHKISERLAQSDLVLFTNGGCHIFAKALFELLPDENYEPRHLRAFHSGGDKPGYHVYLFSDGFAVDALGIKREIDLIAGCMAKTRLRFESEKCDIAHLFLSAKDDPELGPLNIWDMCIHQDYIKALDSKARSLINDTPDRYRVSNLKKGLTIMENSKLVPDINL